MALFFGSKSWPNYQIILWARIIDYKQEIQFLFNILKNQHERYNLILTFSKSEWVRRMNNKQFQENGVTHILLIFGSSSPYFIVWFAFRLCQIGMRFSEKQGWKMGDKKWPQSTSYNTICPTGQSNRQYLLDIQY